MGGHRQVGLPQERPRHRQRIDRIGLAPGARRRPGHAPSSSAAPAPPSDQRSTGHAPAGPTDADNPRSPTPARPPKRSRAHITASAMTCRGRLDDFLPEFAPDLVDGDEGVRALVYIGSNNNHGGCLLHCEVTVGPVGGHISVGAMPRSYQVTPAGPSHLMPTKRMHANPKAAPTLRARHQVIRIQPPRTRQPHPDTEEHASVTAVQPAARVRRRHAL